VVIPQDSVSPSLEADGRTLAEAEMERIMKEVEEECETTVEPPRSPTLTSSQDKGFSPKAEAEAHLNELKLNRQISLGSPKKESGFVSIRMIRQIRWNYSQGGIAMRAMHHWRANWTKAIRKGLHNLQTRHDALTMTPLDFMLQQEKAARAKKNEGRSPTTPRKKKRDLWKTRRADRRQPMDQRD